jgi:hypothetical protein
VAEYSTEDARLDLAILREQANPESAGRLGDYLATLETRTESAERVCRAAAEMIAPSSKRDTFQQRQTAFLQALAEWRATQ